MGEAVVCSKLGCVSWGQVEDEEVQGCDLPKAFSWEEGVDYAEIGKIEGVDKDDGKTGEEGGETEGEEAVGDCRDEERSA